MSRKLTITLASLLLVLMVAQWGFAAAVDSDRARLVAENYLEYVTSTYDRWKGDNPVISSIKPVYYQGATVFWQAEIEPTGYMLISSRDELSPVKIYSEEGSFVPDRVTNPNAPESWIIPTQYKSVIVVSNPEKRTMTESSSKLAERIDQAWALFGQTEATDGDLKLSGMRSAPSTVGPIITAAWDQSAPYNDQTPGVSGSCSHTLVGCVATAWSMLLRHWQWPDRGVGSYTHTWNFQDYTVNFAEQTWDWANMPDSINAGSPQAQKDAIAKLCYQVGVAAKMNWGCSSSGSTAYANDYLDVYFKYKSSMALRSPAGVSEATWFGYFRTDFDATPPRPIIMSIFGNAGGHEILADGYQIDPTTNKVHLNMGWAGASNAYYDLTSDFTTGAYIWDASQTAIVTGIEPDYTLREATINMVPVNTLLLDQ